MNNEKLMNDGANEVVMKYKVRKLKVGPLIGIIVIVLFITTLATALFAYNRFINDPVKIFTKAINIIYEEFHEYIKDSQEIENTYFNIEENSISVQEDINLDGTFMNFNKLKDTTFKANYGLDYKNDLVTLGASISENNTDLLDGTFYFKCNKGYVESNTLLSNIYSVDLEENIFENIDIKEVQDSLDGESYTINDLDNTIASLKEALITSLNEDNMDTQKVEIEVNEKKIKVNKISYKLDKESTKDLFSSVAKIVLDDEELLKNLSKILEIEEDTLINYLKELMDDKFYEDFEDEDNMEFIIYTTRITFKFVKAEVIDKTAKLELINYGETHKISFIDFEKNDTYEINVKTRNDIVTINLTYNKEQILKFTFNEITDELIDVDYEMNIQDSKFKGNLVLETKIISDTEMSGSLKLSCDMNLGAERYDLKINSKYKILVGTKIEANKLDKAIDLKDFQEVDSKKAEETLTKIENSNLYKYILELAQIDGITPVNPTI